MLRFSAPRRSCLGIAPALRMVFILACLLTFSSSVGIAENRGSIGLATSDGRTWLIDSQGQPFFAHGVTHVGNRQNGIPFDECSKAIRALGFNAYGYGCPPTLKGDLPYVEGRNFVPISTYRGDSSFHFIDIFSAKEKQQLQDQVKQVCLQNRDNENLIGYLWTDLAAWPLENSTGKNWVNFIRSLPPGSPGQKRYQQFLREWSSSVPAEPAPAERDRAFLRIIAKEYFRIMGEANRKYDPDHLIFGDRFAFNTIVPEVINELVPWVDAIAIQPPFQPGFPSIEYERIHKMTGKPILICDFAIRFKDGDSPIRGYKPVKDPRVAGQRYGEYVRAAMKTPYIIGVFWCNPMDSKPSFGKTGIKQGLFGPGFSPRPELNLAIKELNEFINTHTPTPPSPPND